METLASRTSEHPIVPLPAVPFKPYYESGGITIYHADCRQVLPFLPRFDLLLTDPPYGIGLVKRSNSGGPRKVTTNSAGPSKTKWEKSDWDDSPPSPWIISQMVDLAEQAIVFGGNFFGMPPSDCWLVWDKDNGTNDFADCELAWTNMQRAVRKFKWKWHGMIQEQQDKSKAEIRIHPAQKPLALMRWCLSLVPDCETVLDPYMGSGTTLVASKLEGRRCVGIEIDEAYCEAASKRLSQGTLF